MLNVNIQKQLKKFELNVRFEAGEGCLGILGPSGCGKSMTLKSIAGIVQPNSGRITLGDPENGTSHILYDSGRRINEKPQRRHVGYLFQNYALFPNMTVADNIACGLRPEQNRQRIVGQMITRFRLDGLERSYPAQLSGGQQQRVALARILAYEPEVLLFDEPFSAMDTFLREGLRLELARILKSYQGISVLVTHDRDEAYQLCDHLMLLDEGRIIASGRTKDLFENPVTVQAARLTGCKNISRIERIDRFRVRALDWGGLELVTGQEVSADIRAIGIRAHDFEPLTGTLPELSGIRNLIPVEEADVSEMPFEWYITLKNGIWWKREKTIHMHEKVGIVPEWLRVNPSAILLLK
ncbi:MAG: ATP-binding cassette domain-containing protein [Lachnospiraceae bacterium]|nr:ATP-binding cassette domain-containing protein [Lachnospiraceae bacterium]